MSKLTVMEFLNEWARAELERLKPAYNEQVRRELDFLRWIETDPTVAPGVAEVRDRDGHVVARVDLP